jgi:hypothetical protein
MVKLRKIINSALSQSKTKLFSNTKRIIRHNGNLIKEHRGSFRKLGMGTASPVFGYIL